MLADCMITQRTALRGYDYLMPDRSPDLSRLLESWLIQLRGQRKSPHTLRGYRAGVQSFLTFCAERDLPTELTKSTVSEFMASHGGQSSTARLHLTVIKLFARWLATETGFDPDPILAVRPPKLDQHAVADLSDRDIYRMLLACDGRELRDKRDKAMLILFAETGLRAAEMAALDIGDLNVNDCTIHVVRGKGGKGRRVRFSVGAAAVVDRYLRAREQIMRRPKEGPLWISRTGGRLSYRGMANALKQRAADAGVQGFHIHRLRHSAAVRWMRKGGSETGLMAHAGWSSRTMIGRYVAAASEQLAGDEFDRLDMGIKEL
jgi:integrase/recombinase XerD